MTHRDVLEANLIKLKAEHRNLNDIITCMGKQFAFDQPLMQRLKRWKIKLKNASSRLQTQLAPDIIA